MILPPASVLLANIKPDPANHRPLLDTALHADRTFIDSIRTCGILTPLVVRQMEDRTYRIVSGHRRYYAAVLLRKTHAPCVLHVPVAEDLFVDIGGQIAANDMHQKMSAWQRMRLLGELASEEMRNGRSTWEAVTFVARQIGKPAKTVHRYVIAYDRLTPNVRMLLQNHPVATSKLSMSSLVTLSALLGSDQMMRAQSLLCLAESVRQRRTVASPAKRIRRLPGRLQKHIPLAGILKHPLLVSLKATKRSIVLTIVISPVDRGIVHTGGTWTGLLREVFEGAAQGVWAKTSVDDRFLARHKPAPLGAG